MFISQTYNSAQENATIITPSSGKAIYVWQTSIHTTGMSSAKFLISDKEIESLGYKSGWGPQLVDVQGAVDEVLSITCPANTTVKIFYEEV